MKTFKVTNRVSATATIEINRIIETHDAYKNSYFFIPNSTANGRRKNEERFAFKNPDVAFIKGDERIEVSMTYNESCHHVYYSLTVISIKGEEKTVKNIAYVKKLLK